MFLFEPKQFLNKVVADGPQFIDSVSSSPADSFIELFAHILGDFAQGFISHVEPLNDNGTVVDIFVDTWRDTLGSAFKQFGGEDNMEYQRNRADNRGYLLSRSSNLNHRSVPPYQQSPGLRRSIDPSYIGVYGRSMPIDTSIVSRSGEPGLYDYTKQSNNMQEKSLIVGPPPETNATDYNGYHQNISEAVFNMPNPL